MELSLGAKCNARLIKGNNQIKSYIQSCRCDRHRCKNFNLKQVSGLMGGRGEESGPPAPPPGSATVKLNERIGVSVGHLVENDQNAIERRSTS